ncbi:thiamine pyrophosphate-binding protein [Burkholderia mayonis]|nr:thiamine pyrophosphate-binding protein [Burkholderia mayonis]KVE51259.1 hypothetical protein WS71_13190 [Burkholderia mayonis]
MASTIADDLAQTLAAAGVTKIWGVTGDSLNGLSDSLRRIGGICWMHTRHEEAAAFAAGAEAAETGRLAVCAGSCGPGNLHLINGLFDCHRNHVPVLAIAAQIPSTEIGLGYFQETHPQALFQECSHYVELVTNASQFPRVLERAMLLGDLLTARQLDLPIKVIVYNNSSLGFVAMEMMAGGYLDTGTDLHETDFAAIARGAGIHGLRVTESEALPDAIRKLLAYPGPALLDVVTDKHELAMPPKIEWAHAKGFSLYMLRAVLSGRGDEVLELAQTNLR